MKRLGILAFAVLADVREAMEERSRGIGASAVAAGREAEGNEGADHQMSPRQIMRIKTNTSAQTPAIAGTRTAASAASETLIVSRPMRAQRQARGRQSE